MHAWRHARTRVVQTPAVAQVLARMHARTQACLCVPTRACPSTHGAPQLRERRHLRPHSGSRCECRSPVCMHACLPCACLCACNAMPLQVSFCSLPVCLHTCLHLRMPVCLQRRVFAGLLWQVVISILAPSARTGPWTFYPWVGASPGARPDRSFDFLSVGWRGLLGAPFRTGSWAFYPWAGATLWTPTRTDPWTFYR